MKTFRIEKSDSGFYFARVNLDIPEIPGLTEMLCPLSTNIEDAKEWVKAWWPKEEIQEEK